MRRLLCVDCLRRQWWVWVTAWPFGRVQAPCPLHERRWWGPDK